MKKILVLLLITACFSFACVKAHYENDYMVYETQKTVVHICIMQSGCSDKRYTYFVLDKKTALITEVQYNSGWYGTDYKTYNTNSVNAKLIAYDHDDTRRKVLRNHLENEYVKCLIK